MFRSYALMVVQLSWLVTVQLQAAAEAKSDLPYASVDFLELAKKAHIHPEEGEFSTPAQPDSSFLLDGATVGAYNGFSSNEDYFVQHYEHPRVKFLAVLDGHGGRLTAEYLASPSFFLDFTKLLEAHVLNLTGDNERDIESNIQFVMYTLAQNIALQIQRFNEMHTNHHLVQFQVGSKIGGSTFTAVVELVLADGKHKIAVINLGDSRTLVIGERGKLIYVTEEHSVANLSEIEKVKEAGGDILEGRYSGVRFSGSLLVTRSFGDFEEVYRKGTKPKDHPLLARHFYKPDVHVLTEEEVAEATHIALASDGIEEMESQKLASSIITTIDSNGLSVELAKEICENAIKNDDRTLIIAQLNHKI